MSSSQQVSQKAYTVAVLGATGLVGKHLLSILESRRFPVDRLLPLASERSAGATVSFCGQSVPVQAVSEAAFEGVDIVLASAGGDISKVWVPVAVAKGAVVIDNTSCFRLAEDVPLVVAGVNNEDLTCHKGIVANPNCSTAQLMPVLKTLHEAAGLKRVIISTYQSVSGAGKEAMDELKNHTQACCNGSDAPAPKAFARSMAFNLIPHIDVWVETGEEAGYCKEEVKLIHETRKILHLPNLPITATVVRVPVMVGHSEAVTLEFERPLSPEAATQLLAKTPHVVVGESAKDYHTPAEIAGTDPVYVGRIRKDTSNPTGHGLNLWVVADNLRIGAALNAVRIAEVLVEKGLLSSSVSACSASKGALSCPT